MLTRSYSRVLPKLPTDSRVIRTTEEILAWLGVRLAGALTFGLSIVAWQSSSAGLCLVTCVRGDGALIREQKQATEYGGQAEYENSFRLSKDKLCARLLHLPKYHKYLAIR